MFSVKVTTTPVYIMDDNGDISKGIDCTLIYNGHRIQFVEKNGLYAYAGFFENGNWPDEYYEDDGIGTPYFNGNWVKMISGGWNEKLSNLVQTIGFMLISIDDQDEDEIVSFIARLKKGEGIISDYDGGDEDYTASFITSLQKGEVNLSNYYGEIGLTLRNYEGDGIDLENYTILYFFYENMKT
jgi:hypothetical protein